MRSIRISDITLAHTSKSAEYSLSFKDKIDIATLIDKLSVDMIEVGGIEKLKVDSLRIKSISAAVKKATIAIPVELNEESVLETAKVIENLGNVRLQVKAPVSAVQMEYLLHMKAAALKGKVAEIVGICKKYTDDVEFVALDATRSEESFLYEMLKIAVESGATTVSVCDGAGIMLPDEFEKFITGIYENVPELKNVTLGIACSDQLGLSAASIMAAVRCGAGEIKAAAHPVDGVSLSGISALFGVKGEELDIKCSLRSVELKKTISKINDICNAVKSKKSPFDDGVKDTSVSEEKIMLSADDDKESVIRATEALGYELSDEDIEAVWEAFSHLSKKKDQIGAQELDAIVTSVAMQVPMTYELDTYVINIGNKISNMAHIILKKDGEKCEGMALGDGPIDAAFLAIENITGHHYVLDDFQIRSVTEGYEAMGETVVKLQSDGKIYPGKGISTDIVGSAVRAYINALNKIIYEEAEG